MSLRRRLGCFGAALSFAISGGAALGAPPPTLRLAPAKPGPAIDLAAVRRHRAAAILFWRTDCAPCLLELRHLSELRRASGKHPLLLVAMESREMLQAGLRHVGQPIPTWLSAEEPGAVLTRFGGAPPRLPLAVAVNSRGNICRVRHGLIGSNTVKQWMKACD